MSDDLVEGGKSEIESEVKSGSALESKVVAFPGSSLPVADQSEVQSDVVEVLEELLVRAKSGDLQGIIGVGVLTGTRTLEFRSEDAGSEVELIGLLETLKFALCMERVRSR